MEYKQQPIKKQQTQIKIQCSECKLPCKKICNDPDCVIAEVFTCTSPKCMQNYKHIKHKSITVDRFRQVKDTQKIIKQIQEQMKQLQKILKEENQNIKQLKQQQKILIFNESEKKLNGAQVYDFELKNKISNTRLSTINVGLKNIKIIPRSQIQILTTDRTRSNDNNSRIREQNHFNQQTNPIQQYMVSKIIYQNSYQQYYTELPITQNPDRSFLLAIKINPNYRNNKFLDINLSFQYINDQSLDVLFRNLTSSIVYKINYSYTQVTSKGIFMSINAWKELNSLIAWSGPKYYRYINKIYDQQNYTKYLSNKIKLFQNDIQKICNELKQKKIQDLQINFESSTLSAISRKHIQDLVLNFDGCLINFNLGNINFNQQAIKKIINPNLKSLGLTKSESVFREIQNYAILKKLNTLILQEINLHHCKFFSILSQMNQLNRLTLQSCLLNWNELVDQNLVQKGKKSQNLKYLSRLRILQIHNSLNKGDQTKLQLILSNTQIQHLSINHHHDIKINLENLHPCLNILSLNCKKLTIQANGFEKLEVLDLHSTNLDLTTLIALNPKKLRMLKTGIASIGKYFLQYTNRQLLTMLEIRGEDIVFGIEMLELIYEHKELIYLNLKNKAISNQILSNIKNRLKKITKLILDGDKMKLPYQYPSNLQYFKINQQLVSILKRKF